QRRPAVGARDGKLADQGVVYDAVGVLQGLDDLGFPAAVDDAAVVLGELSGSFRRKDFDVRFSVQLGSWSAKRLLGGVVDEHVPSLDVFDPGQSRQMLHEPRE